MIPKPPPREGSLGFLYIPPFRIQGISIAGEATVIQAPELDVCFDMGACPRAALASKYVAITHGHMDHVGGLAYYCSQRRFQGMGDAKIICDRRVAPSIKQMMSGFVELEQQVTPYELTALGPGEETQIKNNIALRMFETDHTSPSCGYVVIEKRSKLKEEFVGFPQEKLMEIKEGGTEITRMLEIPLVAYIGDTAPGAHLIQEDILKAQIVVCECTFIDPEHKERARIGKHMHIADIAEWIPLLECEMLVLTHVSRRTNLAYARKRLNQLVSNEHARRIAFLMDHKSNRERYEKQREDATERESQLAGQQQNL